MLPLLLSLISPSFAVPAQLVQQGRLLLLELPQLDARRPARDVLCAPAPHRLLPIAEGLLDHHRERQVTIGQHVAASQQVGNLAAL